MEQKTLPTLHYLFSTAVPRRDVGFPSYIVCDGFLNIVVIQIPKVLLEEPDEKEAFENSFRHLDYEWRSDVYDDYRVPNYSDHDIRFAFKIPCGFDEECIKEVCHFQGLKGFRTEVEYEKLMKSLKEIFDAIVDVYVNNKKLSEVFRNKKVKFTY